MSITTDLPNPPPVLMAGEWGVFRWLSYTSTRLQCAITQVTASHLHVGHHKNRKSLSHQCGFRIRNQEGQGKQVITGWDIPASSRGRWQFIGWRQTSLRLPKIWCSGKILWPKRNELMTEWRKLHNEELHNLYSSPNIIRLIKLRKVRWVGNLVHKADQKCIQYFIRKPEGKKPLRRPRCWEDIIKMDFWEFSLRCVWIRFIWHRIGHVQTW
jgi:hypothetical protein